jgi:DNA primase
LILSASFTIGAYRGNVEGSDARYSFHHTGQSGKLYVFEAPIDMMSFLTMNLHGWQEHSYVALCGVSPQAMLRMLEQNPQIREVALCLDNDAAGIAATNRLMETLNQAGYDDVSCLMSDCKDWNEQLAASFRDEPEEGLVMSM